MADPITLSDLKAKKAVKYSTIREELRSRRPLLRHGHVLGVT